MKLTFCWHWHWVIDNGKSSFPHWHWHCHWPWHRHWYLLTLTLKMTVIVIGLRGQLKLIITHPERDALNFNLLPLKLFLFLPMTLVWNLPLFCHCHRHCHHEVNSPDLEQGPSSQICRHCTLSSSSLRTRHTLHLSSGCQPSWQPTSYSLVCFFFLFSCFYVTLVSSSPVVPRCHFIDRTCRRWRLPARPGSSLVLVATGSHLMSLGGYFIS